MTDKIEIQGKTVEAAVSEALLQMGARRDEVEIKVLEEPKSGFMGFLGGRAARVLVRKKRSRGRGGSGRDHRVDDDDYKAHNLGNGRGRSRSSSRRRPSSPGGSSGDSARDSARNSARNRNDSRQASRESDREEKSGTRRGSRGRGSRGRTQEAAGRGPKQDQPQDQRQDQRQGQRQGQQQGQRQGQQQGQQQDQPRSRGSRNRRGVPRESRNETPIRPLRQEPVDAPEIQNVQVAPPVSPEPKPIEKKEESTVTTPKKTRRGFGGLGARIKERHLEAKAAEAAKTAKANPPAEAESPAVVERPAASLESPAPTRPTPEQTRREPRTPSYASARSEEEVILSGIKGVKYAKSVGSVTDENLDDTLTELTDGMLARAGFPCRCETLPGEYRQIKVNTDDASAGMLIGRHGQAIDAVEHLVERMASNAIDARARINLDINNYRQRREESLAERVAEASAAIQETGRAFHMEPMSARERRLVHMEAAELGGLRTFTMDGSGGKHVVITREEVEANEDESPVDRQDDGAEV